MNRSEVRRQDPLAPIRFLSKPMPSVVVKELRAFYRRSQSKGDIAALLARVLAFADRYGGTGARESRLLHQLRREDLRLICFDHLCSWRVSRVVIGIERSARQRWGAVVLAVAAALLVLVLTPCRAARAGGVERATRSGSQAPRGIPTTGPVAQRLRVEVLATYPHDPTAFTQGLELHAGMLYESTGLYGRSSLRQVDLLTGVVFRRLDLPANQFGEGLTRVANRLVQLTWHEHVALIYDLATFAKTGEFAYGAEGWGLCFDGTRLVMSDGSDRLFLRDPETFAASGEIAVKLDGGPPGPLNELECVGGSVYANVWLTDRIVEIDQQTGCVRAVIDASDLLSAAERAALGRGAILNGIAYDAETKTFLVTGKLWPKLFRVRFVQGP